jgi:hypothetical protein
MSLEIAAKHLASKGRGPDTQLVHMSPREVAGLQALAMSHGGSLSINPETGLPEAGFLDNLLPTIIGAGLMFATGGTAAPLVAGISNPALIGLGIGGLETLRTGDLSKGVMAGLGAYGGAGLTAGLAGPGMTVANPQAAQVAAQQAGAATAAEQAAMQNAIAAQAAPGSGGLQSITLGDAASFPQIPQSAFDVGSHIEDINMLGAGVTPPTLTPPESGIAMGDMGITEADMRAYRSQLREPTFAERLKAMPGKDLAKYGLAAAAPVLLAPPEVKAPAADTEQYRYAYTPGRIADPEAGYTGASTGERMYFQPQYTRLADGGTVENMSSANVYDMQRARGGVSDLGVDMSTGQQRMAAGGMSHLGDYSDGGRLLRGPGDGVSDSIPATIANKRPARLADGEFVIPARIVSELGNGSTEAGARKLYAMMDRVQRARGKTTGKGKVAKNTRAEKYLPA